MLFARLHQRLFEFFCHRSGTAIEELRGLQQCRSCLMNGLQASRFWKTQLSACSSLVPGSRRILALALSSGLLTLRLPLSAARVCDGPRAKLRRGDPDAIGLDLPVIGRPFAEMIQNMVMVFP